MTWQEQTARILDRLEPDTLPSERCNQIVGLGAVWALQMRDPNDGSGARYQYLRTTDAIWGRRLPAEGDCWYGASSPPAWEALDIGGGIVHELVQHLPAVPTALLVRELFSRGGAREVCVCGEWRAADEVPGCSIAYGPITDAWYDVPLPACPDCGAELAWAEAGYVPGTRKCVGCGSFFNARTK